MAGIMSIPYKNYLAAVMYEQFMKPYHCSEKIAWAIH